MENKKTVRLPGMEMIAQSLLGPFIPLFIFAYIPLVMLSTKDNFKLHMSILMAIIFLLYITILLVISKFGGIAYSGEEVKLIGRFGKDFVAKNSDIVSISYLEWLRVYVKNWDFIVEKKIKDESNNNYPDPMKEIGKGICKNFSGLKYCIYPALIRTKHGSKIFFVDEKTFKELNLTCSSLGVSGSGKIRYNEKWNWLIFALAIFGICFIFIYMLSRGM